MDGNKYFRTRVKHYRGTDWRFVEATHDLLLIYGEIERTKEVILIRQYRTPVDNWVLSLPMGAFVEPANDEIDNMARQEAENETGLMISSIRYVTTMYRSPGMATEKAHLFRAVYSGLYAEQILHPDEEIEVVRVDRKMLPQYLTKASEKGVFMDASIAMCFLPQEFAIP